MRSDFWMRERPVLRVLVLGFGIVVVGLLLARLGWSYRATQQRDRALAVVEQRYGKLDSAALAPPDVPDERNRAQLVRAAVELLALRDSGKPRTRESGLLGRISGHKGLAVVEDQRQRVAEIVQRNAAVFELLARMPGRPESDWDIPYEDAFAAEIPNLLGIIQLQRLIVARGRLALLEGRRAEAEEMLHTGFALAASLDQEPVLIVQLVRLSLRGMALELMRDLLDRGELTETSLVRLAAVLGAASEPDTREGALVGELRAMNRAFLEAGGGEGSTLVENFPKAGVAVHWLLRPFQRREHRYFLERMDRTIRQARRPWPERDAREFEPRDADRWFPWADVVTPDLSGAITRWDIDGARLGLARIVVALHRHRARHGAYPARLADLVPELLADLPQDPFTQGPFEYSGGADGFELTSAGREAAAQALPMNKAPLLAWSDPP